MQQGAALHAGGGEQVFKSDDLWSVLTRRLRETPKGVGIKKYLRSIPATHTHVVDCIFEI
jgi:hypothetical protein